MKIGEHVFSLPSCTSTNDIIRDMALQDAPEGTVVLAEEQTSGKGRYQRDWFSLRGKGLYLSILLRPPHATISLLTLTAGLAVADALKSSFGIDICLKWPNDLLWKGKKLGGILSESSFKGQQLSHVIVGIGININHKEGDFPANIRETAISLKQITHHEVDRDVFLQSLWKKMEIWYDLFMQQESDRIVSSFIESSCYSLGQNLIAITDSGAMLGTFKGIDKQGGIILETREGINTYFAVDLKSLQEAKED